MRWSCHSRRTGSTRRSALHDGCVVVADEAYADYVDPKRRIERARDVEAGQRVVVLRTLSKLFGIAGLRLGYAVADPQLAHYLDVMQEPYNVNRGALAAGRVCLAQPALVEERRLAVAEARAVLCERLRAAGLEPLPSQTNFVLVRTGVDDAALAAAIAHEGLLVRAGGEYGLDGYVRVTVGPSPLIDLLRERDYVIRQMPCPELAFGGARRFWGVREQFDTPLYRRHCRRLAKLVAAVIEQHAGAGDDVVLIGVDSSPTMGVDFTPSAPHWAGKPDIAERGLPMPRSTGVRHWFADYDPAEELRRLESLLA